MAIRYKVIPRKSPRDKSVKYYGVPHITQMNSNQFIDNIVQKNTCTRADVLAVLASVKEELVNAIRNGQSVTLGEIGTFRFTIKSKGTETRQKFTSENIRSVHVRFMPTTTFRQEVSRNHPYVTFLCEDQPEEEGGE